VVAVLQEQPVSILTHSRLRYIFDSDSIKEGTRTIDARLAEDAGLQNSVTNDRLNTDGFDVHGLRGTVILILLLACGLTFGRRLGVAAEACSVTVGCNNPPAVADSDVAKRGGDGENPCLGRNTARLTHILHVVLVCVGKC